MPNIKRKREPSPPSPLTSLSDLSDFQPNEPETLPTLEDDPTVASIQNLHAHSLPGFLSEEGGFGTNGKVMHHLDGDAALAFLSSLKVHNTRSRSTAKTAADSSDSLHTKNNQSMSRIPSATKKPSLMDRVVSVISNEVGQRVKGASKRISRQARKLRKTAQSRGAVAKKQQLSLEDKHHSLLPTEVVLDRAGPKHTIRSLSTEGDRNKDYCISGETREELRAKTVDDVKFDHTFPQQYGLLDIEKKVLVAFINHMHASWPINNGPPKPRAQEVKFDLAIPYALAKHHLIGFCISESSNLKASQTQRDAAGKLLLKLDLISERSYKVAWACQKYIWDKVVHGHKRLTPALKYARKCSLQLHELLLDVLQQGRKDRSAALWVGVTRIHGADLKRYEKKLIVEYEELHTIGLDNGAFNPGDAVVLDHEDGWIIFRRPPSGDRSSHVVILWEKKNAEDNEPADSKVIGAFSHSVPYLNMLITDLCSEEPSATYERILDNILQVNPMKRGKERLSAPTFVKSVYSYNVCGGHELAECLKPHERENGKPIPANKQAAFRIKCRDRRAITQLFSFVYLEGFLPLWAKEQFNALYPSGFLTRFGSPKYQAYSAFAYYANAHTDDDSSPGFSTVNRRDSTEIHPFESNFFIADFRILIELNESTTFFWRPHKEYHGTTVNKVLCYYPTIWKQFAREEKTRSVGQVTTAFAVTEGAMNAATRIRLPD